MRGSFRIIHNSSILAFAVILLSTTGCADSASPQHSIGSEEILTTPLEQQADPEVLLTGTNIAYREDDNIIFSNTESKAILATIVSTAPHNMVWSNAKQQLFWVETPAFDGVIQEESTQQSVIRVFDTTTGEVKSLHWSRTPITALTVSPANGLIAFVQDNTLYTFSPYTDEIHRIADWVEAVEWSKESSALIVSARKTVEYIVLNEKGEIASRLPLTSNARFAGATFLDAKTIIGLQWTDEKVLLQKIDLRTTKKQTLGTWSDTPEDSANQYVSIYPNMSGTMLMIHELPADKKNGVLWQWDLNETDKKKQKKEIGIARYSMQWISDTQFWYAIASTDPREKERVNVHEYDMVSNTETDRIVNIDSPIYIQYNP